MTLEGLEEMFRGYSAETCAGKFPLVPMGVRAECVRQRNEVAIKLGIISPPPPLRRLLNLQERLIVGFPNFA